ncbi:MAG: DUF2829 domain-containing protein [Cetobacterium sp.]|uniref:DUF2829 domain-containing protein n=1 Tax=Cetobacterium sp. TaxID=2071632 RepID=UPI003EE7B4A5
MDFGKALEALKQGKKVARTGWNGKGMWLILVPDSSQIRPVTDTTHSNVDITQNVNTNSYVEMFNADGPMQPGWLASQTDMLADDWEIVQ